MKLVDVVGVEVLAGRVAADSGVAILAVREDRDDLTVHTLYLGRIYKDSKERSYKVRSKSEGFEGFPCQHGSTRHGPLLGLCIQRLYVCSRFT